MKRKQFFVVLSPLRMTNGKKVISASMTRAEGKRAAVLGNISDDSDKEEKKSKSEDDRPDKKKSLVRKFSLAQGVRDLRKSLRKAHSTTTESPKAKLSTIQSRDTCSPSSHELKRPSPRATASLLSGNGLMVRGQRRWRARWLIMIRVRVPVSLSYQGATVAAWSATLKRRRSWE